MRNPSFLRSFPQTSAHTGPGGRTKLLLYAFTFSTQMLACRSVGTQAQVNACETNHLHSPQTPPANLHINLPHAFSHHETTLSINAPTMQALLFNNEHFMVPYSTVETKCCTASPMFGNQWSSGFISPITFFSPSLLLPLPAAGKKRSLRHQAWQQLPGATKAKNNLILEQRLEENHSQENLCRSS